MRIEGVDHFAKLAEDLIGQSHKVGGVLLPYVDLAVGVDVDLGTALALPGLALLPLVKPRIREGTAEEA